MGVPVVYTAEALSLAALERLVHLDADAVRRMRYVALLALLPDGAIETLSANELPTGWASPVALPELAQIGARWAASGRSLALRVPSAVVPVEWDVLLNPSHPLAAALAVGEASDWLYDPRLVKA